MSFWNPAAEAAGNDCKRRNAADTDKQAKARRARRREADMGDHARDPKENAARRRSDNETEKGKWASSQTIDRWPQHLADGLTSGSIELLHTDENRQE
jgi:hypothetical protein